MTSFYVFIVLLLFGFFQIINSQSTTVLTSTISILNDNKTTTGGNETNQTPKSTILISDATTTTTTTNSDSTISIDIISINESTTSAIDSDRPSKSPSKLRWWLLTVPLVTVAIVITIGFIHYYHRQRPYRRCTQWWKQRKLRFLQNWRSRDDTDNIILQLEQPEIINGQWPPRISFA